MDRTRRLSRLFLFPVFLAVFAPAASGNVCQTAICGKLRAVGLTESFLKKIATNIEDEAAQKVVTLNLLGFLGKADYSGHFDHRTVTNTRAFLKKYRTPFLQVEKRTGVPKEVIAALLWVETKHGKYLGKLPVGETYFQLAHAVTPTLIEAAYQAAQVRAPAYDALHAKIEERAAAKSAWAIEQLRALQEMDRDGINIRNLKGSYAGAFGFPQFIPSSYLAWAKPLRPGETADLFRARDAIASVGNYLKVNGWETKSRDAQRSALFHYNHADGYVDVILKIAAATRT